EDAEINLQLEKLNAAKELQAAKQKAEVKNEIPAIKPEITFDDFAKIDIRVGTILEAQKVPKADKLLQLTIDTGLDKRTILSGIAEQFRPEEVVGKQVCVLVNLAPRKMRGIESQGMVLMAEDDKGNLHFVQPNNIINSGAEVR